MPYVHPPRGPLTDLSHGARKRINECIDGSLEAREALMEWWAKGVVLLANLPEDRVTLCDAGSGVDLRGVVESLKPRGVEYVRAAAEEVARDREQC